MSNDSPFSFRLNLSRPLSDWLNDLRWQIGQVLSRWFPYNSSCDQAIADALREQYEQERLINQVATQIRQSLELPVILDTAVHEIRRILQADRLVIFQFTPGLLAREIASRADASRSPVNQTATDEVLAANGGKITYEARSNETIPSVLNLQEGAYCWIQVPDCQEKYRKGMVQAVNDITAAYTHAPCLLKMMQQAQIQAKLVAPIVLQDELWGLLIAHQCDRPRLWLDSEASLMQRLTELLAIAIQQSRLYTQLQQQAQTLEQRVIERTQELRDTLTTAQAANQTKAEFLAMMSHELRTPLTCIIGMSNTLLRLPPGTEGERFLSLERQRDYLKTIQNSGEHLLELINDILDLSQVESGRMLLDIREFSLSQLAGEVIRMLKEKAREKQIQLSLELDLQPQNKGSTASEPDYFLADPLRMKQILLNLLSNAIKFTQAGGKVTLRIWKEDEYTVFQVQDTGIGIPADQKPLLFNKFQQLDMSRQRRYEGTGLGLALTKQLVDLHSGWIEVESTVQRGSTFTVWIPSQTSDLKSSTVGSQNGDSSQLLQGRIVLIEDQEETATLICDLLTAAGYQVIWMVKGSTVLQQIEILRPVMVLMNSRLNWLNARDILHSLRHNPLTQSIRVLALTPAPPSAPSDAWLTTEANDYFLLPIQQPEQLLDKVMALLS